MAKARDTDKGWKALQKRAQEMAKGSTVQVGILGDDASKPHQPEEGEKASSATIGEIGEFHEFGMGNNPVRSWLRGYVDANNARIQQQVKRLAEQVVAGKMTPEQALNMLGLSIKGGIQKRIADGIMPQVTAATQLRKGPSKTIPLINSGQFRGSINYKVVPGIK